MTHDPVKNRRQRKARRFYRRLAVIVAALFAGMLILALVLPDKELSVREKRVLASFPKPYLNRVAEGDYGSDLETYVSDQIPFRNFFTDVKVYTDLLAGKRESQGVFRARDGYFVFADAVELGIAGRRRNRRIDNRLVFPVDKP